MNAQGGGRGVHSGDQIGDFRITELIGKGGMGSVYLAEDLRLARRIALKVIEPSLAEDPGFRRRFEAEARSAAAIEHPNVVAIFSAGSADGVLYLAMRYVEGEDLDRRLISGPVTPDQALPVLTGVAAALDAAHEAGLVHRDVKPANILLEGAGPLPRVFLTDFGLTRRAEAAATRLTQTGELIATLDYAAPEQIQTGWIDARTDVYALGCVLYRMLSGSLPYPGTATQKMWKIVNEPLPSLPEGMTDLDRVIARATAKDPSARFPSAGDLAAAASQAILGRRPGLSQGSVATGAAASGYQDASTAPLATETLGTARSEAPHEFPTAKLAKVERSGPSRRRLAVIAALLALIGASVAVAAIALSSNSGEESAKLAEVGHTPRIPGQRSRSPSAAKSEEGGTTHSADTVTQFGEVGTLAFGASTAADVSAIAGQPAATAEGTFETPTYPPYRSLGYGCGPTDTLRRRSLTYHASAPYCNTIYYINAKSGRLGAFWTSSPHFMTIGGTKPGMSARQAEEHESQKVVSGCRTGIFLGSRSTGSTLLISVLRDEVLGLENESATEGVGLEFC